jgi:hypothetical protein
VIRTADGCGLRGNDRGDGAGFVQRLAWRDQFDLLEAIVN